MKITAITHAEKNSGINPCLTARGENDIAVIIDGLFWNDIKHVLVGTGTRFNNMLQVLTSKVRGRIESVKYSPLLGSADSGKKTETGMEVYLADGTLVPVGDYVGLIGTPGVDLWAWVKSLQEGTLLLTGREFIGALGVKDAQMAETYVIDTESMTCQKYINAATAAG